MNQSSKLYYWLFTMLLAIVLLASLLSPVLHFPLVSADTNTDGILWGNTSHPAIDIPSVSENVPNSTLVAPGNINDLTPQQSTTGPTPPPGVEPKVITRLDQMGGASEKTLSVPGYTWRHGCGPTSLGMVIGYYDVYYYPDLIPGDAATQTEDVNQAIASQRSAADPGHYEDYVLPIDSSATGLLPDKSELPLGDEHANDCIADFMKTSWSSRGIYYGWSWSNDIGPAFVSYMNHMNHDYIASYNEYFMGSNLTWDILTGEIDNNRPMVFLVDSNADGMTDHFVTVVGYRDTPTKQYGCLDTWAPANVIRWCDFKAMANGQAFGIWGGDSFSIYSDELTVTSVNPNQGFRGESLENVAITGSGFNGANGVEFGSGITVNDFTVDSSTHITTDITIDAAATTGTRDVLVTTPGGTGTLNNGFTINQGPITILTASDGAAYDYFGYSVAISGDTAIVGACLDNVGANMDQGSAYVFVRNGTTWSQQVRLTASNGAAYDYFGYSVAISGDTAIVGACLDDVGTNMDKGSAYIFVRTGTTWSQQAQLTVSDGTAGDEFGISVAISEDTAIIGAPDDDVGANGYQGSAYVFVRTGTTWSQQAQLTASDGAAGDEFGYSVAISGDTAIVGACLDDVGTNMDKGSAYVFVRTGTIWSQQAQLTASDGAAGDEFGYSVAISGDTAIIGAPDDDVGANGYQGSAYVFVRTGTTWSQQAQLTASDGDTDDYFGHSVAVSVDTAIVGACLDNVRANGYQDSAYVFLRNGTTWSQQAHLIASDGAAGDEFGISVAVSGDTAVVGAFWDDVGTNVDQGSAYIYDGLNNNPVLAAPTNVYASDGSYSDKVQISWTSVSGATGYKVFRSTTNSTGTTAQIGTATVSPYDDTTAVAGTTYYYWIKATNASGDSSFSSSDSGWRTEVAAPYTSGHNPADSANSVPVDTNIVVHVLDDGSGVDQSTIVMTVEGTVVTPAITGSSSDYTLTYDPPADFGYLQVVDVTIDASDLASNAMTQDAYSFITAALLMEGDVNLDGHVTITDAMLISRFKAGLLILTDDQLQCADTTDDGNVSIADAMHISQWLVDPDGSLGVLFKPLWESPADDSMLQPVPKS